MFAVLLVQLFRMLEIFQIKKSEKRNRDTWEETGVLPVCETGTTAAIVQLPGADRSRMAPWEDGET